MKSKVFFRTRNLTAIPSTLLLSLFLLVVSACIIIWLLVRSAFNPLFEQVIC